MSEITIICVPHGELRDSPKAQRVLIEVNDLTPQEAQAKTWPEIVRALTRFIPTGHYIAEVQTFSGGPSGRYRYETEPDVEDVARETRQAKPEWQRGLPPGVSGPCGSHSLCEFYPGRNKQPKHPHPIGVLEPGATADMWHAGTQRFYHVQVVEVRDHA